MCGRVDITGVWQGMLGLVPRYFFSMCAIIQWESLGTCDYCCLRYYLDRFVLFLLSIALLDFIIIVIVVPASCTMCKYIP